MLLFLSIAEGIDINAQDTIRITGESSIGAGFGYLEVKDKSLFPIVSRGGSAGVNFRKEWHRSTDFYFDTRITFSHLKTALESDYETWNGLIGFTWTHLFPLIKKAEFGIHCGYTAGYIWDLTEYPVWDESHAYWSTVLSAGIALQLSLNSSTGQQWINRITASPAGLGSRSDPERIYAQEKWTLLNILKITNSDCYPYLLRNNINIDWYSEYSLRQSVKHHVKLYTYAGYAIHAEVTIPAIEMFRIQFGLRYCL